MMQCPNIETFTPSPVDAFLVSLDARGLSRNTIAAYGAALRRLGASVGRDPVEVDHSMLGNWIAGLKSSGLSASSRSLHVSAVREFLGWAVARGLRETNPLKSKEYSVRRCEIAPVKTWTGLGPRAIHTLRTFAEAEVNRTNERTFALRDLATIILLSRGALRASECAAARCEDFAKIDDEAWALTILGKGSKRRIVPFNRTDAAWILRWKSERGRVAGPWTGRAEGPLLLTERGDGFSGRAGIERILDRMMAGAGLPKAHPHQLRHSRINEIANAGPIQVAQVFAGHSSPEVTQIYTRKSAGDLIAGLKNGGVL